MKTTKTYTQKEMIEFGFYLLSEQRNEAFKAAYSTDDNITLTERLQAVYQSDLDNFFGYEPDIDDEILNQLKALNNKMELYLNRNEINKN